jgi:hypothetical protein
LFQKFSSLQLGLRGDSSWLSFLPPKAC